MRRGISGGCIAAERCAGVETSRLKMKDGEQERKSERKGRGEEGLVED